MRVVVSMTTIPARAGTLARTIESLQRQTRRASEIRIYATADAAWDGAELDLGHHDGTHEPVPIVWLPSVDHGPLTKISAVVDGEVPDDALVVTVDDDIDYAPTWLETLVAAAEQHPDEAIGMSGWNVHRMLSSSHGSFAFVQPPATCDVLEGWSGAAYRRQFFRPEILQAPPEYRFVDDVWISAYLNAHGIRRRVICRPLAREAHPHQMGLHNRPDFRELNRRAVRLGFPR